MNFEAAKPVTVLTVPTPKRATPTAKAAVPQVTATIAEEQERRARRMKQKIAKHQIQPLKFIDGEPVTEESDRDADDRNLTREDVEQAMVEAVVIIRVTDPARLNGVAANEERGSSERTRPR